MHVRYDLSVPTATQVLRETQVNRFFSVPEMRLLAESAGLDVRAVVPAYAATAAIELDTFHVLLVAEAGR